MFVLIAMAASGTVIGVSIDVTDIPTPITALAGVVAVISFLVSLWWLTRPSAPGTNDYGPNPHEAKS